MATKSFSKNKKIGLLLVIALAFCAAACFAVYSYCTPKKSIIYVFNAAYSAGTPINASMVTPIEVDSTIVESGKQAPIYQRYVTSANYDSVMKSGDSLLNTVYKGQALTLATLSVSSGSAIEMNMKSTAIAVTIPVNNITGVTSALRVGSRVNIYSSVDNKTDLLLQNMRIINVTKSDGELISVTIETNHEESLKLIQAANFTKLYCGLVDSTNYVPVEEADKITDEPKE